MQDSCSPDGVDRTKGGTHASELVAACEMVWAAIQRHHPDVPDVVIVLGTGVERGRLVKLGHWWGGRWVADGQVRGEVLLAGEALHLPPEAVFEVLLHEAAHGLNAARGVKDSSRGGRYHNGRFRATAEDLGLIVGLAPPCGWARTSIGPVARERHALEIARLGDAMRIARRVAAGVQDDTIDDGSGTRSGENGRARTDSQQAATCQCGRRMRMAPSVLAKGPVLCGLCGQEFSTSRTVAPQRGAGTTRDASLGQFAGSSELNDLQREGLAALVALGTQGDGALLLAQTGAWYSAKSASRQRPLVGATYEQVEAANQAARAMLKLDGTLRGPSVIAAGRELSVGEFVTVGDSISRLIDADDAELPPFAVFGSVEAIDLDRRELAIDFATAGRHMIAIDSAAAATIEYAYAERAATADEPTTGISTLARLHSAELLEREIAP